MNTIKQIEEVQKKVVKTQEEMEAELLEKEETFEQSKNQAGLKLLKGLCDQMQDVFDIEVIEYEDGYVLEIGNKATVYYDEDMIVEKVELKK